MKRSPAIYRKYLCTPKAVVEGGKWRVDFNVSLRDGSIERWTGEGTVFPFAIGRLDRAQLEKPGAVLEAFVVEKGGGIEQVPWRKWRCGLLNP